MLIREMPVDVRRMLQERFETMSLVEAAKVADSYFDSEGRPRHSNQSANSVNAIPAAFEDLNLDDDDDINAVGRKQPQRNRFRNQRKNEPSPAAAAPNPRNGASNNSDRGKPPQTGQRREYKGPPTVQRLCKYHVQFGDNARTCERGCDKFGSVPSNGKAGRQA